MSVTVITAFHNCERYLRATVESVARQTVKPEVHLLVDDASTDGSIAIAERLSDEYAHVRILRHTINQGYPAALNTGIAASNSDFVAILDGDDIALPDWLESVLPVITKDPNIGAVGGGCIIMTQGGYITNAVWLCSTKGDVTEQTRNGEYNILHPGTVFRRRHLDVVGSYDPNLHSIEDADLFIRVSFVARLYHVGKPLVYYRRLRISESRKSPDYVRAANEYLKSKAKLLSIGKSTSDANAILSSHVHAMKTIPRLSPKRLGTYRYEMAKAFEIGGRRWMAIATYIATISTVSHIRSSIRGIGRCLRNLDHIKLNLY